MKGLNLSKKYFEEYGKPMLTEQFPELMPYLCVGLFGSGSECFGYDDENSQDHDFEAGFCIFLPGEDAVDRKQAFALERAYAKLPKEFEGYKRPLMQPVGGNRKGVFRAGEFFKEKIGYTEGGLTLSQWLTIPQNNFAEMLNGEIFFDNYGLVSSIRGYLSDMPMDVLKKRLAGHVLLAAQAGQYNYPRCLKRGERAGAQLALNQFAVNVCSAVHLLNRSYAPYYKWLFRSYKDLPLYNSNAEKLQNLLLDGSCPEKDEDHYFAVEAVCSELAEALADQGLSKANCGDLEKHAYSVNDGIEDGDLRNSSVLSAV